MGRIAIALCVLILLVLAIGMVVMGAFPPSPHVEQVQRVLPNDKFK